MGLPAALSCLQVASSKGLPAWGNARAGRCGHSYDLMWMLHARSTGPSSCAVSHCSAFMLSQDTCTACHSTVAPVHPASVSSVIRYQHSMPLSCEVVPESCTSRALGLWPMTSDTDALVMMMRSSSHVFPGLVAKQACPLNASQPRRTPHASDDMPAARHSCISPPSMALSCLGATITSSSNSGSSIAFQSDHRACCDLRQMQPSSVPKVALWPCFS